MRMRVRATKLEAGDILVHSGDRVVSTEKVQPYILRLTTTSKKMLGRVRWRLVVRRQLIDTHNTYSIIREK